MREGVVWLSKKFQGHSMRGFRYETEQKKSLLNFTEKDPCFLALFDFISSRLFQTSVRVLFGSEYFFLG